MFGRGRPRVFLMFRGVKKCCATLTSEARCFGTSRGTSDSITIAFFAGVSLHRLIFGWGRERRARRAGRICSKRVASSAACAARRVVARAEKQALEFGELLSVRFTAKSPSAAPKYSLDQGRNLNTLAAGTRKATRGSTETASRKRRHFRRD